MARPAAGVNAPLEAFVRRHHQGLLRFAKSRGTSPQCAEDLVSQAYSVFLERAPESADHEGVIEWAWNKDRIFDYCCKTIKFLLANQRSLKRNRKTVPVEELAAPPAQIRIEPGRAIEARLRCREILERISDADARLLFDRYVEGYAYVQLSKVRGLTPSALRQRVVRAKQRARASVSQNCD